MILQPQDLDKLLIRASMMGSIMPSEGKTGFTDTQMASLVEVYNSFFFHRRDEIKSKYFTKGHERENDSITLLSLTSNRFYKKNTTRLNNEWATGEWDIDYREEGIIKETVDTKSAWSKNTFDKSRSKKVNPNYVAQGHVYMWLTGAEQHTIAHCLVNNTHQYIRDETRRIQWAMGILDGDISTDPKYIEKIKELEINNIFDIDSFMKEAEYEPKNDVRFDGKNYSWDYDVPALHRVHKFTFKRDEAVIAKMKARVLECRKYIYNNLVLTLRNK